MSNRYNGLSPEDRAGCFAAVIATPIILIIFFGNFMPDFVMPEGSIWAEVFLPALLVGGGIFLGVKTVIRLASRKRR